MSGTAAVELQQATMRQCGIIGTSIDPSEATETLTDLVLVLGGLLAGVEDCLVLGVRRLDVGLPALTAIRVFLGTAQVLRTLVSGADRGVQLHSANSCVMSDCRIVDTVEHAVGVSDSVFTKINGCSLESYPNGLWVAGTSVARIYGASGGTAITGNTIVAAGPGSIALTLDTNGGPAGGAAVVTGNILDGTGAGGGGDSLLLTATEINSVVVGNAVRGGTVTDLGVGNTLAHNV
jgi:hypothetical protein